VQLVADEDEGEALGGPLADEGSQLQAAGQSRTSSRSRGAAAARAISTIWRCPIESRPITRSTSIP
jgi:hypothetical protein